MAEKSYLEDNTKIIEFLKQIPIFGIFDEEVFRNLIKISKLNKYQAGQTIMREGETDTHMYFLVQGTVEITKKGQVVATLRRRGDVFGEMGAIEVAPRSASARAKEDTLCLSTDFLAIEKFARDDKIYLGYLCYRIFSEILVDRLRKTTAELMELKGKKGLKFW
jgi:CRP/FNR family cyclic AMP-dependent transcriptional regulator